MSGPKFIDNLDGNTLAAAVARILQDGLPNETHGVGEASARPGHLDVASAFFSPSGFAQIADDLADVARIRLMVGAEPPKEARPPRRQPGETQQQFERRLLREGLHDLDEGLREERDRFPFSRSDLPP